MNLLIVHYRPGTSNLYRIDVDALDALGEDWTQPIEEQWGEPAPGEGRTTVQGGENDVLPNQEETQEEPEYVDDVHGIPDEEMMEWLNFLRGWKISFPEKAQPKKSNTKLRRKFYARLKDAGFRAKWRSALWTAKEFPWAHKEGWFKAAWFLHNDDNFEKLLDGTFDFKNTEKKQAPAAKRPQFVDARPKEGA
jgi:carboxypeptidase C (cathepsin A)